MTFSVNNRLILEQYVKEGLRAKVQGGIATPGQRDGLKGLKVLVDAKIEGRHVPAGSIAYIKEKTLHEQPWAANPLSCDTLPGKFMIVEAAYVEFIDSPYRPDDAA